MRNLFAKAGAVIGGLLVSTLAFAQDGGMSNSAGLIAIGAGIAMAGAAIGAALAQGKTAHSYLEGITRNPTSKDGGFTPFILAISFIELQSLLGFVIAFMLQGKM